MRKTATFDARCYLFSRAAPKYFLFTLVMIIATIFSPISYANAKDDKCLVLIQLDGKWVSYDRLAEIAPSGKIMLNAKLFSNAIGFSYKEDDSEEQFTIAKSKKDYNLYTTDKMKYTQYANNLPVKEEYASYPVYLSYYTSATLIQSDTIDNLCYHKSFVGNEITEYSKNGYDTVLCFSTFADITDVPKVDQVMDTTVLRNKLIDYAMQAKNTSYKYGGDDLSKGVDTSGFTQAIYKKIGYQLPKSSKDQLTVGEVVPINDIHFGDLVFYGDKKKELVNHVGIYIGNNKIIHAKNKKEGVTISDINYRQPYCAARIIPE
jgi:cell wall-associated NlpC family hydrolase